MSEQWRPIPDRIGLPLSVVLFGIPGLLLWGSVAFVVPAALRRGSEPLAAWFLAGLPIFAGLFLAALLAAWLALPKPSPSTILRHLRVRRMEAMDWRIAIVAIVATLTMTAALYAINASVWPRLPPHPPFIKVEPLRAGQYYQLALWVPFFFFNIVGEEIWWRGFIQPRQEPVFGRYTWVAQGLLHGMFHLSFGLGVLFLLIPALFAIPWAVQRTGNTSVGMVIHAIVNGPAFLAVSLGLLQV